MALKSIRPILWTSHLQASIQFYSEFLQFQLVEYQESWQWASLNRDGVEIMLAAPNEHLPFDGPNFTGSLYILTDDLEDLWQRLKNQVNICYPLEEFEWEMREFAIYDNNGYIIQFGEPIKNDSLNSENL